LSVIALLCALLLCLASASRVKGLALTVVDTNGSPLSGVFVVYDYYGYGFGFGEPGRYTKPGSIIQTDNNGRFRIRSKLMFCVPGLQAPPNLRIHAVWSPQTHNRAFLWLTPTEEMRVPGILDLLPAEEKLVFHDLTANSGEWYFMLEQMQDLLMEMQHPGMVNLKVSNEMRQKLRTTLDEDTKMFKSKHGNAVHQDAASPSDPRNGKTYGRLLGR
jgi:hypothetical protein